MTSTDLNKETEALAGRLIAAIEAGDSEGVRACFAPDAMIWHNNDRAEQGVEQVLRVLGWMARHVDGLHYADVRRQQTATGYVEQHVVRGTAADGTPVDLPAVLVVAVDRGLVTRIDEYFDASSLGPLAG